MMTAGPPLDTGRVKEMAERGEIDTILLLAPDMQGRLQGKRVMPRFFLDRVVPHKAEGCNYLLAVDVEMTPVPGYDLASWERGYGDLVFAPDLGTLRPAPWQARAALVLCDLEFADGSPVEVAPRTILARQCERLRDRGLAAYAGTELEFLLFRGSYEEAWRNGYRSLVPANLYNVDYSLLGTSRVEPLIRRIRNAMDGAGIAVENSKGECNFGQHEINFAYADVLAAADGHVVYKESAKAIAAEEGYALTFMPKFNEREGNSCHIHLSLRDADGGAVFAEQGRRSAVFEHFLAGLLAHLRELMVLFAPNVNSYKRYARGSFAPTALAWGEDNRTCALRVVGHGDSLRVENRVPGGDVNPYLALAGMLAAGLDGIEQRLPLGPAFSGNAYAADLPRVPRTLAEAAALFSESAFARAAFGESVVRHYTHTATVEVETFNAAVTDWERFRGFERM